MAGIVLAGGLSRRMGRDKALIDIGGETLLQRAVRTVAAVAPPVIVVADQPGRFDLGGVEVIGDDPPGAGPLAGLVTGLRFARAGYCIALACDMPLVRAEVLRLLLARAEGFEAAVPWIGGRPEPLCAVYHAHCSDALSRTLTRGGRAIHKALDSLRVCRVMEYELRAIDPELVSFNNVNEPADLDRILESGLLNG